MKKYAIPMPIQKKKNQNHKKQKKKYGWKIKTQKGELQRHPRGCKL